MFTIGLICLVALATCSEDGIDYEDYTTENYDDIHSGSGSGDDDVIIKTTIPAPSKNKDGGGGGGGVGWAIFGGILGGLGALSGLAVLGRRFCKKSKYEKDLDYDYYDIIHKRIINKRTSSSYA